MERRVRDGGLFRCCLDALWHYDGPDTVGTVLPCPAHPSDGNTMVVASDGVWEWSGAAALDQKMRGGAGGGG